MVDVAAKPNGHINKLLDLFKSKFPLHFIWPYIVNASAPIKGKMETFNLMTAQGQTYSYVIYIPPGYEDGDEEYPVLYHLHGAGVIRNWVELDCNRLAKQQENAVRQGSTHPHIIVAPIDKTRFSMWVDSVDGQSQAYSKFMDILIPHVESTYKTIAKREGRALSGFSMGGFGAAITAFKKPDCFNKVVIWDGAIHTWDSLYENRRKIARSIFGGTAYFNSWSPWKGSFTSTQEPPQFFIVTGELKEPNENFVELLKGQGAEVEYISTSCGHDLFCMLQNAGQDFYRFLGKDF
ncbi:alpha/beta hydrolase [Flexibacterium corallicola]|uniref:alpha/beta hydrolase n=1 Tax=Flexibacterium corallicola TaxID=3037259 RepID=UPI00286EF1FD|nr:alpha/beta hydrolase-fold protein [Pseudovibrio sp. M1P-2-3]